MAWTLLMRMVCSKLRMMVKQTTKATRGENGELKQILLSACVCVDIFMSVKTKRRLLGNLKFSRNKYVTTWPRRKI